MKENWCWEREVLRRISKHHESGAPLPDDLIEKMIAAKNAHTGLLNLYVSYALRSSLCRFSPW